MSEIMEKKETATVEAEPSTTKETTQAEQTGPEPDSENTFTREQVSAIVQERLARERKGMKAKAMQVWDALDQREADLAAKERRLECQAFLQEKGYPVELLDQIDMRDVDTFKDKAEKLHGIFSSHLITYPSVRDGGEVLRTPSPDDGLRSAFDHSEHKPKDYTKTFGR